MCNLKQSHIRICRICGQEKELTFEHVPPKSAFNNVPRALYSGEIVIKQIADPNRKPWEYDGIKYEQQQQGAGYYSLCAECNSKTGAWYVPEYENWAVTCHKIMKELNPQTNDIVEFKCRGVKPLPILKQVMAMFCSVSDELHNDKQLTDFILNKDSTNFNKEKYKVYMYLFKMGMERRNGLTTWLDLYNNEITTASEIAAYPLGFVLCTQGDCSASGSDISHFGDYEYYKECNLKVSMHVHECNSIYPLDYRTKAEIEEDSCRHN